MRTILFLAFLVTSSISVSAQHYDNQWVFGYGVDSSARFGLNQLDFNEGEVNLSYYGPVDQRFYRLGFAGSILCSAEGRIKYHTNHCAVYDTSWNRISGPGLITPTGDGAQACGSLGGEEESYGSGQGSILIPSLTDSSTAYVLHKDMFIDFENEDLYSENFWFSTITRKDSATTFNRKYTMNEERLVVENLTAIPNKAQKGWWVLIPRQNSNTFERFLIESDTVYEKEPQSIGISYVVGEMGIGQAQYSPGGTYFAINTEAHGVLLYEFNNETGRLSNFRKLPYPNSENVAQGMCFSPNDRFIYVTTAENAYQIDLEQDGEVYHIGKFNSRDETGWHVGLGMIFQGPDCRLYVSPGSGTYYLHVILNPNEKNAACTFVERAIEIPASIPFDLPNIPQYRYLNECDNTISFPFTSTDVMDANISKHIRVYPNPTKTTLTIDLTGTELIVKQVRIRNGLGQCVKKVKVSEFRNKTTIDMSDLPAGIYYLTVNKNSSFSEKIIKYE